MFFNNMTKKIICVLTLSATFIFGFPVMADWMDQSAEDSLPSLNNAILDETYLSSNQFTQADNLAVVDNFLSVPDTYLLVGETDSLMLYMERVSYAIRIVNKVDGFIYGSSLGKKTDNYENFNLTWENIVNSAVTLKYYDYNDSTGIYTSVEESFLKSSDSTSSYRLIEDGFEAVLYFGESGIGMTLSVQIVDDYLVVDIPNSSITEGETFKLRSIKAYPFLGAVYGDSVPGYVFVPDGSGALIRYLPINVNSDIYEFRYYGLDDSITSAIEDEPLLAFPVSGMIHGIRQHGFIQIVEAGAPFASLTVSPAKNNLKYYYTYNEFLYRSLYASPTSESQADSQSGSLVIEKDLNSCDLRLKYRFLAGNEADYVGMANAYQDYLLEQALVVDQITDTSAVSIFMEVIASENKDGFIFDETLILTDLADLNTFIDALKGSIEAMTVVYKGFTKGGATGSGLIYDSLNNALGTKAEFVELIRSAAMSNVDLYFYIDPMKVYADGDFSLYKDITQRINQSLLSGDGMTKPFYYVTPERIKSSYLTSVERLKALEIGQFALGSVGNKLYSDYKDKTESTDRAEVISILASMFEAETAPTVLYQPYLYLLKYTEAYLALSMTSSRYRIYSDTVPFTAYVLQGLMPKYAPFQNFTSSSQIDLLRMVDYNVYPSYILTEESAYQLQDTELRQIYSSEFSTWKELILVQHAFIKDALSKTVNARVDERSIITTGLYKITYSNGVILYVNYTNQDLVADSLTVPALNYKVVDPNA